MVYYIVPICFVALVLLVRLYSKRTKSSLRINSSEPIESSNSNYSAKKSVELNLSQDLRVELSWRFLYDITDYVLNKFSKEDAQSVTLIGRNLIKF
jgi:hypothetical protein